MATEHYPDAAMRDGIEGSVFLLCVVIADGRIGCAVQSETPPGYGFGEAAMQLSRSLRLSTTTTSGRPSNGMTVRVPISFRLPD